MYRHAVSRATGVEVKRGYELVYVFRDRGGCLPPGCFFESPLRVDFGGEDFFLFTEEKGGPLDDSSGRGDDLSRGLLHRASDGRRASDSQ